MNVYAIIRRERLICRVRFWLGIPLVAAGIGIAAIGALIMGERTDYF